MYWVWALSDDFVPHLAKAVSSPVPALPVLSAESSKGYDWLLGWHDTEGNTNAAIFHHGIIAGLTGQLLDVI